MSTPDAAPSSLPSSAEVRASLPTSAEAAAVAGDLAALRRVLHANPEVGLELPATQQLVKDAIAGLEIGRAHV